MLYIRQVRREVQLFFVSIQVGFAGSNSCRDSSVNFSLVFVKDAVLYMYLID